MSSRMQRNRERWHEELNTMSAHERGMRLRDELSDAIDQSASGQSNSLGLMLVFETDPETKKAVPSRQSAPTLLLYLLEQMLTRDAHHEEFQRFLRRHYSVMKGDGYYRKILRVLERYDILTQWELVHGNKKTAQR
jgi:hypothetical protein